MTGLSIAAWIVVRGLVLAVAPPASAPVDAATVDAAYVAIERQIDAEDFDAAARALRAGDLGSAATARLQGRLAMAQQDYPQAVRAFAAALAEAPRDLTLRLYLARSQLSAGDPGAALTTLEGTDALAKTALAQPLLRAAAQRGLGDDQGAYATLRAATVAFADATAPRLELTALCAEAGLSAAARAWGQTLVPLDPDLATVLAVLTLLHTDRAALPLMERLAAAYPGDGGVRARLAYGYAAAGHPGVAARLFDEATALGAEHSLAAADQYRVAGRTAQALVANARVPDARARLRQRVEILYAAGDNPRMVALTDALTRAGVDDADVQIRLAYAHYALGQYARATALCRSLLHSNRADRARALLRAMGRSASP